MEAIFMKVKSIIALILIVAGLTIFSVTRSTSQQALKRTYTIKLYSGGNVVATWIARDFGRIDDQTLIFTIGDNFRPRTVRITGTYSVEESAE